ncbi:gamma-glutamylcyclotransferase [Synechococcus sp. CCY 9618]|uniref:gamma-glutamylcyclotransferase n=1 Tax=Synechococcus sp. CCY 9618 TaxID=2815602 RepID=UPI001C220F87
MADVFVYGSHKRGLHHHGCLEGAAFEGRARLAGARLHSLGAFPMAVLDPAAGGSIHGEVYRVDDAGLAALDALEGYPHVHDRRRLPLSDGREAWVYHGAPEQVAGKDPVLLGDWWSAPVFSYGSNMDPLRLRQRCPGWDGHGLVARLEGWRWGINKRSITGAGCAGIIAEAGSHCWGVVHHLGPDDLAEIDRCEGAGTGRHYERQTVAVTTEAGERFDVLTYVPVPQARSEGLAATADYAGRILRGADHWQLPSPWRQSLAASLLTTAQGRCRRQHSAAGGGGMTTGRGSSPELKLDPW